MDQEKIGKLIKEIRKKNNLTQKDLADKYGVTYQAVSKWENGKNIPDISLLKQMSKDFNINIEDILEGNFKEKEKHKKTFLIVFLVLLVTLLGLLMLLNKKEEDFSFKTISSSCSSYTINGSMAYNKNKSSIYISSINYCGKEDNTHYKKIECVLYESENGKEKEISKYKYDKKPITIKSFLKDLTFNIDDYAKSCKKYTKDSLYLKLTTQTKDGEENTHKIELSINDNCKKK